MSQLQPLDTVSTKAEKRKVIILKNAPLPMCDTATRMLLRRTENIENIENGRDSHQLLFHMEGVDSVSEVQKQIAKLPPLPPPPPPKKQSPPFVCSTPKSTNSPDTERDLYSGTPTSSASDPAEEWDTLSYAEFVTLYSTRGMFLGSGT